MNNNPTTNITMQDTTAPKENTTAMDSAKEVAIFGGGCFWCTEAVFKMMKGVSAVKPGYAGGTVPNPTYDQVSSGKTGHAEVIYIEYDPSTVSYKTLLTVFFASHDPTTLNRQGADVGAQYRSVIFYTLPEQKEAAEAMIQEIDSSNSQGDPVVTEVIPLDSTNGFYDAETYHQDYFANHKDSMYCHVVINPKLEKIQKEFAELMNPNPTKIPATEEEWKEKLTPEQYRVLREKGTEAPFSGKLAPAEDDVYKCVACGNPLFKADAKFDSGTGWPSFDQALPGAVRELADTSHGMARTETVCAVCGSHLGHVFEDGPTETGRRYCMNGVCLN